MERGLTALCQMVVVVVNGLLLVSMLRIWDEPFCLPSGMAHTAPGCLRHQKRLSRTPDDGGPKHVCDPPCNAFCALANVHALALACTPGAGGQSAMGKARNCLLAVLFSNAPPTFSSTGHPAAPQRAIVQHPCFWRLPRCCRARAVPPCLRGSLPGLPLAPDPELH